MKKIAFTLSITLFFLQMNAYSQQSNSYQKEWEKVASLEKRGLYRSAWEEVNVLYKNAVTHHNNQEQIKALIYQLKYCSRIEENADVNNIREVDSLSKNAKGAPKAILQSMLAEMYRGYVNQHRFQLYNRITSASENESDITTWGLSHLYNKIASLYKASLQNETELKRTELKNLQIIVDTGKNTLSLQPALYDLLGHRALDYFTGEEPYVIRPAVHFIIDQSIAFAPASLFAEAHLQSADSSSLQLYALRLYQQLIRFHLKDVNPDALMDLDLQRLQYVYRKAVIYDKDSLYLSALEGIIHGSSGGAAIAEASYLLANYFFQRGNLYNPFTHPADRYDLKKALEICESVPANPATEGSVNCRHLKSQILGSYLSLETEEVNVSEKPFRALIKYKQAFHLYFCLVKLPDDPKSVFSERYPAYESLTKRTIFRQWEQTFPDPGDYQPHAAEMKVDGLPVGRYALMVSMNKDFSKGETPSESTVLYVSNISYISNNKGNYIVLNRVSGQPVPGAKVTVWSTSYNAAIRKNEIKTAGNYTTDKQGFFKVKQEKSYTGLMPEITVQGDHLFTGDPIYTPYVSSGNDAMDTLFEKTYLFMDRSVYRPGQTVFFKGIVFNYNPSDHQSTVVAGKAFTVYLYDANNQKADSLRLVTNDFGSYTGSFVLPEGLLNGQMHIAVKDQNVYNYFSVEDYKHPTFYVQWDTTAHPYQLGDNIRVRGSAEAYSGAAIDGATVKYQVTRKTQIRFPFPWFRQGPVFPGGQVTTLSQDITKTDAQGNFDIRFIAIPDEQMDSIFHPVFVYNISVDITDVNGESHHFDYSLPLGYTSLQLAIEGNDKIDLLHPDALHISSTDLSGKFIPTSARISFYPLTSPDRFIRRRYWQQPDEFIIDKKDYLKYFPQDEYKDEGDPATWEKLPAIESLTKEISGSTAIAIPSKKVKTGWYVMEVTGKDEHGRPVSATKYLKVYNPGNKMPVFHDPLWISVNETTARPGETASWYLSSDQQVNIIKQKETLSQTGLIQNISLDNELKPQSIPLTENDRGGIIYHYVAVKDNRLFTQSIKVNVPWENKQLDIHYETFRDKLLPGAKEEWRMKITGTDGQKVSAELLASMYDASLDAFRPHSWQLPDIYPSIREGTSWNGGGNFSSTGSYTFFPYGSTTPAYYEKIYPSLNWFGYNPSGFRINLQYASALPSSQRQMRLKAEAPSGYAEDSTGSNQISQALQNISPRTNFNETAFFLPQLRTDKNGHVIFSFTMPGALTKWKLMLFAHTREMQFAYSDRAVITQKPLMIQANAPRFVRQGDEIGFSAKVSNLSKDALRGNALLELTDAVTGISLNNLFKNETITKPFTVKAGQSTVVRWSISIPENYTGVLSYKAVAAAGDFTDGEQNILPVLTNKAFLTESLPLGFRGNGEHHLNWDILKDIYKSSSVQPLGLTIEYTGSPIWYAVQALPFLDEDKLQSADVLYNHFYANTLSGFIAGRIPHFHDIMRQWFTKDTNALKSPLQQNENLKTVVLQETPWVQAAQNENVQKHQIAGWFNNSDFKASLQRSMVNLQKLQLPNGGFSWFKDMPDSRYITQQILAGIGHLRHLKAWPEDETNSLNQIVQKAIPYLDARLREDYNEIKRDKIKDPQISEIEIQYLYIRSFFPEITMADSVKAAFDFYRRLASKQWQSQPPYLEAMIALEQYRSGDVKPAGVILKSLSETAVHDPVKGMYWKDNQYGYQWWKAPVEAQSVCIEAFNEINHDNKTVSDLATWLLLQKETQHWATNRATADAIYALLIAGEKWTAASPEVTIKAGDHVFKMNAQNSEAGLQYKEEYISGKEISSPTSRVHVKIENAAKDEPTWGALYFQYFENMNKVKNNPSPMQIERQISLEKATPDGPELIPVDKNTILKVGDKVQVRLVVKINEDMDYVYLKDVRASCMEPLETLSGYHGQDGAGYYFTVTDAAVHYYFSRLNKGTYVFSYPVYITHTGNYTGGLSTIECFYAPVFRAHAEGIKINVK